MTALAITSEVITIPENEKTTVIQPTTIVIELDESLEETVNKEKDVEASEKSKEAGAKAKESGTKPVKAEPCNKYKLTGNGEMPKQKVNKEIKDINYHNMLVVIAVGDKVINKVGGIQPVAEKWELSFSVLQRALSGNKEH